MLFGMLYQTKYIDRVNFTATFDFYKVSSIKFRNYTASVTHIRFRLDSTIMASDVRALVFKTHAITY